MTTPIKSGVPSNQVIAPNASAAPQAATTPTTAGTAKRQSSAWANVDVAAAAKQAAELLATAPRPGAFFAISGPPVDYVRSYADREISGTLPPTNRAAHEKAVCALLEGVRASLRTAPDNIRPAGDLLLASADTMGPNTLAALVNRARAGAR